MTFNLAQLTASLVIILETEVPFGHKYKTTATFQTLCVLQPPSTDAQVGAGHTHMSLGTGTTVSGAREPECPDGQGP